MKTLEVVNDLARAAQWIEYAQRDAGDDPTLAAIRMDIREAMARYTAKLATEASSEAPRDVTPIRRAIGG